MTERLHPQDLRTIAAAILHAGTFAFVQGQQGQFTNPGGATIDEADYLIRIIDQNPKHTEEPRTPAPGEIDNHILGEAMDAMKARAEGAESDLAQTKSAILALAGLAEEFMDEVDIPERNCSCHISPPCYDCVENAGLREIAKTLRETIKKVREIQP